MRRYPTVALMVVLLLAAGGCGWRGPQAGAGQSGWRLVHPPEVPDESYPRGYHLQSGAPLSEWRTDGDFATREECEQALRACIDDSIDRAQAAFGDDAKNDLTVRRAVNARCVQAK